MFGRAASGTPESRIASSASSAACGPAPWFVPIAATSSSASRRPAAPASMPPPVSASSSNVRSATIGSDETPRTASTAATSWSRSKNVSIMNRSTPRPSSTRACSAYNGPCSPASNTSSSPSGPIAPGDQHVAPGDVARLARQADARRVDRLELVLEQLARQLAAVGAEGVRLDQLGSGADVARVHRDHALGCAQVRLLGTAQSGRRPDQERTHAAVGHDRRAGAQPLEEVRHPSSLLTARIKRCGQRTSG